MKKKDSYLLVDGRGEAHEDTSDDGVQEVTCDLLKL